MDNRLRFLYSFVLFEQWRDTGGYGIALLDMCVQAVSLDMSQMLISLKMSCDVEGNKVPKFQYHTVKKNF